MVRVVNLTKRFTTSRGEVRAVAGVNFEVKKGDFFTLLGPSGCGKSTTLRCIAGLEKPDSGEIYIDDKLVFSAEKRVSVPPDKRDAGMVFQSYAIWPHMTVFDNVAFPLQVKRKGRSKEEIREKVKKVLGLVRLEGFESRPATQLSGGQQQRVAGARALVQEPKVLLLDEPLSNLDAKLREQMRIEMRDLFRRLGVTSIYVTHDQLEAFSMSTNIAVMLDGKIAQVGSPWEIYTHPTNKFVADFVGIANFIEGKMASEPAKGILNDVATPMGTLRCYTPEGLKKEDKVVVTARPEIVEVRRDRPDNSWMAAEVEKIIFLGEYADCRLKVGEQQLRAKVSPYFRVDEGEKVYVKIPGDTCAVIAA